MSITTFLDANPNLRKTVAWVADQLSKISWLRFRAIINGGLYYRLKEDDHDQLRMLLKENYFIILTLHRGHMSSSLIKIGNLFTLKKFGHYVHALMNVEGDIKNNLDFKLIEATGDYGVHYSTFMKVFDCDSICLLKPRGVSIDEWTKVMDKVKASYGKKYDDLFNLMDEEQVSCVELVLSGLKMLTNYETRFPQLLKLIADSDNLVPQMLYDCGELEICYEARR